VTAQLRVPCTDPACARSLAQVFAEDGVPVTAVAGSRVVVTAPADAAPRLAARAVDAGCCTPFDAGRWVRAITDTRRSA